MSPQKRYPLFELPRILYLKCWPGGASNAQNFYSLEIDFSKGYILEKLVKLKKEISVIVTRFSNNKYEIYLIT